ncbi:methylthioribose kinase [Metabacillus sediminilitoris]|uniref:Methylthioribose kinase n=1 Tax=Metabacillus sediminilitoris TaxID=2567941 RepID=A0A4S4C5J9_9BACI|nr:methylthioribose kinase [Metabacillus sediminilitoris]QGQ46969.1 methylthioribose kinase [Metabacillus sediminilitoris]THF83118.1 methylthioribose kinase [Metabacillus sediminilitoris]
MIQRFIELGEGYSDIYELIETTKANKERVSNLIALHTKINEKDVTSLVVIMQPTELGNFQALYICREGVPNPNVIDNKRYALFTELATYLNKEIIQLEVKPSSMFHELDLYYQYIIGILRLNHYLPILQ